MSIEIQCPSCSTRYRVGEDKAGKRMRCKQCQEVIIVPDTGSKDEMFNVFDSTPGGQLYGQGKGRRAQADDPFSGSNDPFASNDDHLAEDNPFAGGFDTTFKDAPTLPPTGGAAKRKSTAPPPKPSNKPDTMVFVGIAALVVIGLAVAAFIYFSKNRDNGGNVAGGGGANGAAGGGAGGGAPVPEQPDRMQVRSEQGSLAATDSTLQAGEYFDGYSFDGVAGQRISILQTSNGFTGFVMLEMPSREIIYNFNSGGPGFSAIRMPLPESGTYRVVATSLAGSETGDYELEIAQSAGVTARIEQGSLMEGDTPGASGAFEDSFTIQGRKGQRVAIYMGSDDVDSLVRLYAPDGSFVENDDSGRRLLNDIYLDAPPLNVDSLLIANLAADGEYRVVATSALAGSGDYTLIIDQPPPADRVEPGTLASGDQLLVTGEFYDSITFDGEAGQRVAISASSPAFDTYLILKKPSGGENFESDDTYPGVKAAELYFTLPDTGEYEVMVTSYRPGEAGNYVLTIDLE